MPVGARGLEDLQATSASTAPSRLATCSRSSQHHRNVCRADSADPVLDPRPRQQVHRGVRRGVPNRWHPGHPHAGTGTSRERVHRTVDRHRSSRVSRPDPDREPPAPRTSLPGLHPSLQRASPPPLAPPTAANQRTAARIRDRCRPRPYSASRRARRAYSRVQGRGVIEGGLVFRHPQGRTGSIETRAHDPLLAVVASLREGAALRASRARPDSARVERADRARRKGISQITEPLGKPGRLEEKEECEVLLCKGDEREERR